MIEMLNGILPSYKVIKTYIKDNINFAEMERSTIENVNCISCGKKITAHLNTYYRKIEVMPTERRNIFLVKVTRFYCKYCGEEFKDPELESCIGINCKYPNFIVDFMISKYNEIKTYKYTSIELNKLGFEMDPKTLLRIIKRKLKKDGIF